MIAACCRLVSGRTGSSEEFGSECGMLGIRMDRWLYYVPLQLYWPVEMSAIDSVGWRPWSERLRDSIVYFVLVNGLL